MSVLYALGLTPELLLAGKPSTPKARPATGNAI